MQQIERLALSMLAPRLREAALRTVGEGPVAEIRLRSGGLLTLTQNGQNQSCAVVCTPEEIAETVDRLCGGSLYAQAENIREGVITSRDGLRAGVCGMAVLDDGRVRCVRDLTSVNIRIPHRVPGAADSLVPLILEGKSLLITAPPGGGKTTVLRELIARLASEKIGRRVAVIDTRCELGADIPEAVMADFYRGYPRKEGIEAAVRTMSPEILVCDELAGEDDCRALRRVLSAGIVAAVSAHAKDRAEALRNPRLRSLLRDGGMDALCVLRKDRRIEVWEHAELDLEGGGRGDPAHRGGRDGLDGDP